MVLSLVLFVEKYDDNLHKKEVPRQPQWSLLVNTLLYKCCFLITDSWWQVSIRVFISV